MQYKDCCTIFCMVGGCEVRESGGCICECRRANTRARKKSMEENPECWPEIEYKGKKVRGFLYIPPKSKDPLEK